MDTLLMIIRLGSWSKNPSNRRPKICSVTQISPSSISYGRPYLGAPLGTQSHKEEFVCSKVDGWVSHVQSLSQVAMSQPHAAYAAFTHGFSSLWQKPWVNL